MWGAVMLLCLPLATAELSPSLGVLSWLWPAVLAALLLVAVAYLVDGVFLFDGIDS